jgi:hypothetical protein
MEIYRDTQGILNAAASHPDPELRQLITNRIKSLAEFDDVDLADLMHVLVLEPGDGGAQLSQAIGLRGMDILPEDIEAHTNWFELTVVTSQDGAGVVAYVPRVGSDPELLAFCQQVAQPREA